VYDSYADFEVHIYASNLGLPWGVGATWYIRVYDGGEPGIGVDWLDGGLSSDYDSYDNSAWPIYEGNIQLHTYD